MPLACIAACGQLYTEQPPLLFLLAFTIFLSYRVLLPVLPACSCHCLIPALVNIFPTALESNISGLNSQPFLSGISPFCYSSSSWLHHIISILDLLTMVSLRVGPCFPSLLRSMFADSCCCQPPASALHLDLCVLSSLDLLHTFLLSLLPQTLTAFSLSRRCICCPFTLIRCSFSLVTLLVPLLLAACQICAFPIVAQPAALLLSCHQHFLPMIATSFPSKPPHSPY